MDIINKELEVEKLVFLLESFLGEPRKHNRRARQISFDCPNCSAMKGIEYDHKGNLEISYKDGIYHCWACGETDETKGRLSNLVRTVLLYKYGGCWFDLDVFFLRSFEPIFSNYSNEICLYNWEYQQYPNNAIYISLEPYSEKMLNNIKYIISLGRGWSFQQALLTYNLPLDILVLPCSWFDPSWVKSHYKINFNEVFKKTDKNITFEHFFNGAFSYHWHNQWNVKIDEDSPLYQLYKIILSNLSNI